MEGNLLIATLMDAVFQHVILYSKMTYCCVHTPAEVSIQMSWFETNYTMEQNVADKRKLEICIGDQTCEWQENCGWMYNDNVTLTNQVLGPVPKYSCDIWLQNLQYRISSLLFITPCLSLWLCWVTLHPVGTKKSGVGDWSNGTFIWGSWVPVFLPCLRYRPLLTWVAEDYKRFHTLALVLLHNHVFASEVSSVGMTW